MTYNYSVSSSLNWYVLDLISHSETTTKCDKEAKNPSMYKTGNLLNCYQNFDQHSHDLNSYSELFTKFGENS